VVNREQLIEALAAHRTLNTVPRAQLEWLADHGEIRHLPPGGVLTPSTGPVEGFYAVLEGHLSIRVDRGAGPKKVMEWHGGDVTGVLPYSRIKAPPGSVVAEEATTVLLIPRPKIDAMIHDCPDLTGVLVHVMLDRARVFKSSELLDEKMLSLGRLAAGLAHELNNPASAAARSAKMLKSELGEFDGAAKNFCALNLPDEQCAAVMRLRETGGDRAAHPWTPIELADREDAIGDWFAKHNVTGVDERAFAESPLAIADLEGLEGLVGNKLPQVVCYLADGLRVRQLAAEIEAAASKIHTLVAAVKGFTYMDQNTVATPVAIGQGLSDTLTVLRAKARDKHVALVLDVAAHLPMVEGFGAELNQVWANLVDNAIDASPNGQVTLSAAAADGKVIVRVVDTGHGIPSEVMARIFDPFFTTKDVGQGTGLGLDIARRIVQRHNGAIDVTTGPSGTEFRVTLPASAIRPVETHS
jgi:signal transduction histidine kinase